jgi:S1-C subfamily serine protease
MAQALAQQNSPSIPLEMRPRARDFGFDLETRLASVIGLKADVPADAFTAETLGRERRGHGVLIDADGLVLTIGYLLIEAETVWLTTNDGKVTQGHPLAFDSVSGLGLVQALGALDVRPAPIGDPALVAPGDRLVIAGAGGAGQALATQLVARQEFAGYWEYAIDEAMFVSPAHPLWGGAGVFNERGELVAIGSLQVEHGENEHDKAFLNMVVPVDLLRESLDFLVKTGRPPGPPRPWAGFYAIEMGERIVVAGLAEEGPADKAGLESGDIILSICGEKPARLADLWKKIWAAGPAGVDLPMIVERDDKVFELTITSADRLQFFRSPVMH